MQTSVRSRVLCENGMPGNDTEGDTYLPPRWSPTRGSPRDREKRKFWVHLAAGAAPYTSFELASQRVHFTGNVKLRARETHAPGVTR